MVRLDTGKPVWSYEIGKELIASPAIADGLVVIGSEDGNVYAFGAKSER
jgi:outer membrane protein assembly factor BamB